MNIFLSPISSYVYRISTFFDEDSFMYTNGTRTKWRRISSKCLLFSAAKQQLKNAVQIFEADRLLMDNVLARICLLAFIHLSCKHRLVICMPIIEFWLIPLVLSSECSFLIFYHFFSAQGRMFKPRVSCFCYSSISLPNFKLVPGATPGESTARKETSHPNSRCRPPG